ncbi:unnamed protein product [Trichogramma brassicae]|uniref:CCHC-type domain-containing protein n=1 Tax=Trichogramma brassicae TaxID=86971 RepID=A0A6H5JB62_9HYME|nr:unnamed protein product [Trichogramma brassicae]
MPKNLYERLYEAVKNVHPSKQGSFIQTKTNELWKNLQDNSTSPAELEKDTEAEIKKFNIKATTNKASLTCFFANILRVLIIQTSQLIKNGLQCTSDRLNIVYKSSSVWRGHSQHHLDGQLKKIDVYSPSHDQVHSTLKSISSTQSVPTINRLLLDQLIMVKYTGLYSSTADAIASVSRRQQHLELSTPRKQPKPRPVQRRARHRPDVIVIKAKDASKYADILRSLKSDPTLQQKVGSSVNNIRRSAAGALMLQLKKGVENASDLGEELGRVLGTAATASSALLHTSTIEIKDLDECATKEEVTAALDALLGVPVSKRDPVKSLRKAYAGTQVAVVALPDDLAATALKLGHVRIGWVNAASVLARRLRAATRCWSPGHVAARCKGPDRTELCYRCGQKGHQAKDCKGQPSSTSITARLPRTCFATPSAGCASTWPSCASNTRTLLHPHTWLADANGQAAIWVHGGIPVQKRPARVHPYFAWARIGGIFFFSVYAPPRLSEREFSALLANITEEARGRRPLVIAGDFNAWSTEWGCRETRPRASILLDSLALLDAVLLNTEGSSIVDLTFVCETLTPRVLSWTVSGLYTHSDHQAIVFEIEDDGASGRPSTRRSYGWNARTLDVDRFSAVVSSASVAPGTAEDMASSLMSVITGACDASMSKANPRRRRREPVYWWTPEIADLRRSCLRARRLFQRSRGRHDEETTARTTPQQGVFCAWRSRPANVGAGGSFATRSTTTSGANHTGLPCHASDARRPSSPAPLSWCAARWRLCFRGCRAGPPCDCRVERRSYIPAVTLEELKGAQSRIKERSAPGPDGIPNSALKIAIAARPDIFLRVYTMCLETGVFPSGWKRQRLVLLPKPGKPPDEPSSYRLLCMLDTAGKILERIICDRLEAFTERPGGLSER